MASSKKPNKSKEFALNILEGKAFEDYVNKELRARTIPPAVLTALMAYGWGKPKEHVVVEDKSQRPERQLTDEQLAARTEQARLRLLGTRLKSAGAPAEAVAVIEADAEPAPKAQAPAAPDLN